MPTACNNSVSKAELIKLIHGIVDSEDEPARLAEINKAMERLISSGALLERNRNEVLVLLHALHAGYEQAVLREVGRWVGTID